MRDRRVDVDLAQDHRGELESARGAMKADEEHAPAAPRPGDRRRGCVRRAARLDDDVETDSVGELEQQLPRSLPVAFADLARAKRARRGKPLLVDVDRDDPPFDCAPRCARHDERADPAGSDDRNGVAGPLRDAGERVERDGQGLRHRCRVVVAAVGNGVADRRRRRHVLGQPPVHLEAERAVLGAQIGSMAEAPADSGRTRFPRPETTRSPTRRAVTSIAEHDDASDELVAEDDAGPAQDGP